MREIIDHLHANKQQYSEYPHSNREFIPLINQPFKSVLMTDPAVAYLPKSGYGAYDRGKDLDIWLKAENGSDFLGVVWPGMCANLISHDY